MPESLQLTLQSALGADYRIERELGGGGMSRVFIADETRFGRRVVIKALAPELAVGVSVERFEREVLLAAGLQNPHIVPVLSAGDADGIPYYTMPFVDGLSLRQRMQQGMQPPELALSVLRNVMTALMHAHSRGIVHRDIKPENVLLSGNTAVVTDFGIAKALLDARLGGQPESSSLTATGTSLGSPAYMAPEQAAGGEVDARADLYAWGVMAYELLAGVHPFAEQGTAQRMIAAHLTVQPKTLAEANPAVRGPLSALVMQCLEKDPEKRPASAESIDELLGAIMRGDAVSLARPRSRRWKRGALVAVAGLLVLSVGYALIPAELKAAALTLVTRAEPVYRVRRAVVAPLANETGDPAFAALGAMASDAITAALSRLSSLETVDAQTVAATALVVDQIPRVLRRSNDRSIAAETGAGVLVTGSYFLVGDSVQFRTRIVNGATGAVMQSLPVVSAAKSSPTSALTSLAQHVATALRTASDSALFVMGNSLSSTTSMEAYEALRAAYTAFLAGDTVSVSLLRRALKLDSMFGSAIALLPAVASAHHRLALADSALDRAKRLRDRLTPFEQGVVDELDVTRAGDLAGLVRASTSVMNAAPNSDLTRTDLATTLVLARQPRRVLALMRGMQPDRGILLGNQDYWWGLASAHAQLGELREAVAAAREGDKRVPGGVSARTEAAVLAMMGDTVGANKALGRISTRSVAGMPRFAATTAALLSNRQAANASTMAKQFAAGWLRQRPGTNAALHVGHLGLLAICERWEVLLALADSLRSRRADTLSLEQRLRIDASRAIAHAHLGQRDKALAIDSAVAALGKPPWSQGVVPLARARIAAHLGDSARAVALLDDAIQQMVLNLEDGVATFGGDPFLLPLREYAAFRALLRPSAADARP